MAVFNLQINRKNYQVDVEPDTPLLWVLRDELELKGAKYGCGRGLCGACTVHLDGTPVRSCVLPVSELGNARITTIEGLPSDGSHPVQRAWMELDVPQCGYCQSGQIMTAVSFLAGIPEPDDEQIDAMMTGHICRCGTYPRIRQAVKRAAEIKRSEAGSAAPASSTESRPPKKAASNRKGRKQRG